MTTGNPEGPYAFRGDAGLSRLMQQRRANMEAAFVLPHLEPGMSIVDFGCGQGTITAGLAEAVSPSAVLGFDLQEDHLVRARALAAEKGLTNLTYQTGDVLEPPCQPESFDVAYANAVLSHLRDPAACLQAMRQVLKTGGLVAVRDRGGESLVTGEGGDATKRANTIVLEIIDATTGNPYGSRIGEVMNRLCRQAGFEVLSVTASWQVATSASMAAMGGRHPLSGPLGQRAISLGVTTQQEIDRLLAVAESKWISDPDAFTAIPWFEVIARKR